LKRAPVRSAEPSEARRPPSALEIACAGGHNILMIGPPGSGKTTLAKHTPTSPRPFTFEEASETTNSHSVAGVFHPGLVGVRARRCQHHTL